MAKYAVSSPQSVARVATILNKYPDRFLFGTDTVASANEAAYFAVFDMWDPVWRQLTPAASLKVRKGNYRPASVAGIQSRGFHCGHLQMRCRFVIR